MHSTIERIREWREASIDTIIVCFNHLFKNYNAEVTKCHYGNGSYTLLPDLTAHYHKTKQVPQLQSVKSADEIVRRVRQSCEPNNSPVTGHLTENQLAKELLQNGTIKFDFKHGKFTIQDTEGDYLVQLFPKPSCTCPHAMASATCSHILACQISIGLNNDDSADPSGSKNNQMNEIDHSYLSSLATLSAVASKVGGCILLTELNRSKLTFCFVSSITMNWITLPVKRQMFPKHCVFASPKSLPRNWSKRYNKKP